MNIITRQTPSWLVKLFANKITRKTVPALGDRTLLRWFIDYFDALESESPGFLRDAIGSGATLLELLPEDYQHVILADRSQWSGIASNTKPDQVAQLFWNLLYETRPDLAKTCTVQWLADSFEIVIEIKKRL